ncbi:hypothetical protein DRW07_01705 [Alteromonas sediminis]|uniref:CBM-cenC domain-containing protein n=1 Tax=Alteromonas sediminis TaxID=2259342 RepID=A0A3N5Y2W7_9ALTE|nr:hypothetical protein [Alteromonas sediminis]RPJ68152.1 hypothetical protein DRW07_01705 [Alteromonas sediminis]
MFSGIFRLNYAMNLRIPFAATLFRTIGSAAMLFCFTLFSISSVAQDKTREIDIVFAKLIAAMPEEAKLIAAPYADRLNHYGKIATGRVNANSDAIGGTAYEITVSQAGQHAYDAGAYLPIGGEIKKGEVIYVLFFARLLSDVGGAVRQVGLQLSEHPYTQSFAQSFTVAPDWSSYTFAGKAHTDYASYEAQISFQLAAAQQQIAIGPVYVLKLSDKVTLDTLPFLK